MKNNMEAFSKIAIITALLAAVSIQFDSWPFARTIIAVTIAAIMLFFSNAQIKQEKLASKKKEDFSRAIVQIAFAVFIAVFATDLYSQTINPIISIIGIAIALASAYYYTKGIHFMGEFFSTFVEIKKNHKLLTTGPFATVRHPLYLSALFLYLGIALAANSLACIAILALFFTPWTYWRITLEEKMLSEEFGKEFSSYRKATPMIIPKLF